MRRDGALMTLRVAILGSIMPAARTACPNASSMATATSWDGATATILRTAAAAGFAP